MHIEIRTHDKDQDVRHSTNLTSSAATPQGDYDCRHWTPWLCAAGGNRYQDGQNDGLSIAE